MVVVPQETVGLLRPPHTLLFCRQAVKYFPLPGISGQSMSRNNSWDLAQCLRGRPVWGTALNGFRLWHTCGGGAFGPRSRLIKEPSNMLIMITWNSLGAKQTFGLLWGSRYFLGLLSWQIYGWRSTVRGGGEWWVRTVLARNMSISRPRFTCRLIDGNTQQWL